MLKGVFLDMDSVDYQDLDLVPLTAMDGVRWTIHAATRAEETRQRIQDCDVIITNKVVLDAEALKSVGDRVSLVVIAATGTNNVDLEAAQALGVTVCNVRDYATAAVAQHVFALILALTTQLPRYHEAVTRGRWQRHSQFCILDFPIRELAGLTLGIVGYGTLGKAVAKIAHGFDLDIKIAQRLGGNPEAGRIEIDELLPAVDVLSLHCPLNEHTRNLIDARRLKLMRRDALLINTARGGIVNEPDLARALKEGWIGGAGIDVLIEEPPRNGNVLLDPDIPNLIVTPHVAWASRSARQRVIEICAQNIASFLKGNPENQVV